MSLSRGSDARVDNSAVLQRWLDRGRNRDEWSQLVETLDLSVGFAFLAVQVGDRLAEDLLAELLRAKAQKEGFELVELRLFSEEEPADTWRVMLQHLRHRGQRHLFLRGMPSDGDASPTELAALFRLLNQKRDELVRHGPSPLIMSLSAPAWAVFRANAPDFWSIHLDMFRFSGARGLLTAWDEEVQRAGSYFKQSLAIPIREDRSRSERVAEASLGSLGLSFVDRAYELRALTTILAEKGARVAVVGPAGIGKSALVARVVPLVERYFPDGVHVVQVLDLGSARDTVVEAVQRAVQQLMPRAPLLSSRDDVVRRYQQATLDRRALFVFEDVEQVEDWTMLAPSSSCAVAVTSRRSSNAGGYRELVLGPLPEADAATLVRQLIPTVGADSAHTVAKRVRGHPLAIRLLAAAVADRGDTSSLEALSGFDGVEGKGSGELDEALRAIIRRVLHGLSPEDRRLATALTVFHGSAHVVSLADVMEVPAERAMELCQRLVNIGLASADLPYISLHPKVREVLASELEDPERARVRWLQAIAGLVAWLHNHLDREPAIAHHGTRKVLPDLLALVDRVGDLEPEQAQDILSKVEDLIRALGATVGLDRIVAAQERFGSSLGRNWSHSSYLATASRVEQLLKENRLTEALTLAERTLAHALATGHSYPEAALDRAHAAFELGRAQRFALKADQAVRSLLNAQADFEAFPDLNAKHMAAACLLERAAALRDMGRLDDSLSVLEEAASRFASLQDRRNEAVSHAQAGFVRILLRDTTAALKKFQQARKIFTELEDPQAVAALAHQSGIALQQAADYSGAEQSYKESLAIESRVGNELGEAQTHDQLGLLLQQVGRYEEALAHHQRALDVLERMNLSSHAARSYLNLAAAFLALGHLDEARSAAERAIAMEERVGQSAWRGRSVLARIEREAGDNSAARQAWDDARRLYRAYRMGGGQPTQLFPKLVSETVSALAQGLRPQDLPPEAAWPADALPLRAALVRLLAGSRDPSLAKDEALDPASATEIELGLEALRAHGR